MQLRHALFLSIMPAVILGPSASAATTLVQFQILDSSAAIASGSFTYDTAKVGRLAYSDLDSFVFRMKRNTYDLGFVQSGNFSSYYYFGWDATSHDFVTETIGGYPQILSAIKRNFAGGFFLVNGPTAFELNDYLGDGTQYFTELRVSVRDAAVPEPATWAMMIGGMGIVGGSMRRRRVSTKVSFA